MAIMNDMSVSTKLEKALIKASGQEIVEGLLGASVDELKAKVVTLASYENETERALKDNEDINDLAASLKEARAPYKDTLKGIKLQRTFIAVQLEQKGKA